MNASVELSNLQLRWHSGLSGLNAITPAWAQLFARIRRGGSDATDSSDDFSLGFVHHPSWYQSFFQSESHQKQSDDAQETIFFLTLSEHQNTLNTSQVTTHRNGFFGHDEPLLAVIPLQLCQQKLMGIRIEYVQFAYNHELAWCDIITCIELRRCRTLIEKTIKHHFSHVSVFRWQDLPESSHAFQSGWLSQASCDWRRIHGFRRQNSERCSLVVEQALSRKKHIKNIERHKRNLQKTGAVTVSVEKVTLNNADTLFDTFAEVEHKNWKGQQQSSLKSMPSRWFFYQAITHVFSTDSVGSELYFLFLKQEGRCIAAQMAIKTENALSLLKIGYDEAFKHYGPGNILLMEVLRQLRDDHIHHLSFVTGRDWMMRWHPNKEILFICYQVPKISRASHCVPFVFGLTYLWVQRAKVLLQHGKASCNQYLATYKKFTQSLNRRFFSAFNHFMLNIRR